jgi:anti-sigma regulatory factor (Ser/Thr protein kinase)
MSLPRADRATSTACETCTFAAARPYKCTRNTFFWRLFPGTDAVVGASPQRRRNFGLQPESVRAVRSFVRQLANDAGADAEAAALLASELAANAVLHANSEFEVRVANDGGAFRVEIVDDAPEMIVAFQEPSDEGGRGLRIVNGLALRLEYRRDGASEGGLVRVADCLRPQAQAKYV